VRVEDLALGLVRSWALSRCGCGFDCCAFGRSCGTIVWALSIGVAVFDWALLGGMEINWLLFHDVCFARSTHDLKPALGPIFEIQCTRFAK